MALSDTELRERLLALGYIAPPITNNSRGVLLKKLEALESGVDLKTFSDSNSAEDEDDDKDAVTAPDSDITVMSTRQRLQKSTFIPQNVGMYSRCYVRTIDFWDRIGLLGTASLLLVATVLLFFIFKFVGNLSERRFRSVHLTDGIFPKCTPGNVPGVTCVADSDLKFTLDNLNLIRAAIHHATVTERCNYSGFETGEYIGMYPLFKDDYIEKLLVNEIGLKENEAKKCLQNAKVLFKTNPQLEMKVLKEGILYRNYRLLRTCAHVSWKDSIYIYALYGIISFTVVYITYRVNKWVNKLRSDGDQERRRLIKDIFDIVKQNENNRDCNFVSVRQVHEWISSAVDLRPKLWEEVIVYLKEHDTGIFIEKRYFQGDECDVFTMQK